MSSYRPQRRTLLIGIAALAGCGFTPAYKSGGTAQGLFNSVLIEAPNNRDSFNFVKRLELRLGQPDPARFLLDYDITVQKDGVGLTSAQETTRYNLVGAVDFSFKEIESGNVITSGRVSSFTGYSVGTVDTTVSPPSTSSTISTRAAEQDAYDRLMVALADQLIVRLIASSKALAK